MTAVPELVPTPDPVEQPSQPDPDDLEPYREFRYSAASRRRFDAFGEAVICGGCAEAMVYLILDDNLLLLTLINVAVLAVVVLAAIVGRAR